MNDLDNAVNRQIIGGEFPKSRLYSCDIELQDNLDMEGKAVKGIELIRANLPFFDMLFRVDIKDIKEVDALDGDPYIQEMNFFINAHCSGDYLVSGGSREKACSIIPVVTPLDKVLWYAAFSYYVEMQYNKNAASNLDCLFYAWIKLLGNAQKHEMTFQSTLNLEKCCALGDILDLICHGFAGISDADGMRPLTKDEEKAFAVLVKKREELFNLMKKESETAKWVAEETKTEWRLFIDVVNDLSEKEFAVINRINEEESPKKKLEAIKKYNALLYRLRNGKYDLDGRELNFGKIDSAALVRLNMAPAYACAYLQGGKPFRLHPILHQLAKEGNSFNYLFMCFHQFRLEPNKDTAKNFSRLALKSIKFNFGIEYRELVSLDDMIRDFYDTVMNFWEKNKTIINRLSFDRIQPNAIDVSGCKVLETIYLVDTMQEQMTEAVRKFKSSKNFQEAMYALVDGNVGKIRNLNLLSKTVECLEEEAIARQLIVSLNIIYMFCYALGIMLSNKHANVGIKNAVDVEQIRKKLFLLDDKIIHKVYCDLNDQEIGMLEYREKVGIDANMLSEREASEERYRNAVFAEALKSIIENLLSGLEKQNEDQLMQTKAKIREAIMLYPECDEKEHYAEWLDSESDKINRSLVEKCKERVDEYRSIKERIRQALGEYCSKLPSSTVDSLTTAEMLYGQYASEAFALNGFDFSCISALYYQAFEDAYNDIIWRDYADMLNNLIFHDGRKYTDILQNRRNQRITDRDAMGYLFDNDPKQRAYYVNYVNRVNPSTMVSTRCMYKSFGILMESIKTASDLPGFCAFFAKLTGYASSQDMYNDLAFMNRCSDFAVAIMRSADNRNNASHGGSYISVTQCTNDKKTVLNELEEVRNCSIGLIQQILYLFKKVMVD